MYVITQHFKAKTEERQKEIDDCFYNLLNHKQITLVYHLTDQNQKTKQVQETFEKLVTDRCTSSEKKQLLTKIVILENQKWLFYSDAFLFTKKKIQDPDAMVCILNADCYLDHETDWNKLKSFLNERPEYVCCQTRVELPAMTIDNKFMRLAGGNTQDGWFFSRKSIDNLSNDEIVSRFSFAIGRLGCDNLIAHQLYQSGFKLINFGSRYKLIHNDYVRQGARDYALVDLTRLGSRLVPDYDLVCNKRVEFLTSIGIPAEEGTKIAFKIIFFAISQKVMTIHDKLTIGQVLTRLSNDDVYRLLTQILNGYVKISNSS